MTMSSFAFFTLFFFFFIVTTVRSLSISNPILLPLTNSIISITQFNTTTHHLLKSTSTRSATRHLLRRLSATSSPPLLSLPLSPGSDYTLTLSLPTTPPQSVSLFLDTGSDLVWFPCKPFTCILCQDKPKPKPYFPPLTIHSSSFVPCTSTSCTAAHSSNSIALSSNDLCAVARCPLDQIETSGCGSYPCPPFYYAYADGSFIARLHEHSISMPIRHDHDKTLTINNFTFGCAHSSLAEPTGVAGFGKGILSFPAQLSKLYSSQLGSQFSYCLVPHSFDSDRVRSPSPLILGRPESAHQKRNNAYHEGVEFVYTPMINNAKYPYFYMVGLEGISVGKRNIPAPEILRRVDGEGNGGVVVDSGTTFTILPSSLFKKVVTELDRQLGRVHQRASPIEDKTGLSPCYYMDKYINRNKTRGISVNSRNVSDVPTVGFRFAGSGSSVVLPRENYFHEFNIDGEDGLGRKREVGCLMLMDGGDEKDSGGGPGATLGNYQQQGFEVVYDLEKKRVGFARRDCASLWDSLT